MYKGFFIFSFLNSVCFAALEIQSENVELKDALSKNAYEPNYFSMLFGLFVVVLLVYLTGFLYQKLIRIKICDNNNIESNKPLVVSNTPLGQGKNLYVIKINDNYCLIGVTQHNITFIKDINSEEKIVKKRSEDEKES